MFYPGVDADREGGHQEGGDRGQERHHRPEVQEDYSQEKLMGNQSAVEYQKKESLTRSFSSFPLSVLILENGCVFKVRGMFLLQTYGKGSHFTETILSYRGTPFPLYGQ